MDRWVGIATVCTAISSTIVGLISVWVMFDQKKMQNMLMGMQASKHQPVFKVKIERHAVTDKDGKAFNYEEVKVINASEYPYILKDWEIDTYAYFKYNLKEVCEEFLINLYDYFGTKTEQTDEENVVLMTSNSDGVRNLDKINRMNQRAKTDEGAYFSIHRKIYIYIKYIDLYGNEQERYFINTLPVSDNTEFLKLHNTIRRQAETSVSDFDVFKCVAEIAPKDHIITHL